MPRPLYALVIGAAATLMSSASVAAALEQIGRPDSTVSVMQNYGVNVPLPQALDTVVPEEWALHVHADVPRYVPLSWTIGQDWPSVLQEFAHITGLSVLISWNERSVSIRPASVSLEEGAKRAELMQGATTPLPAFSGSVPLAQPNGPNGQYAVSTAAQPITSQSNSVKLADVISGKEKSTRPSVSAAPVMSKPEISAKAAPELKSQETTKSVTLAAAPGELKENSVSTSTGPVSTWEAVKSDKLVPQAELNAVSYTAKLNRAQSAKLSQSVDPQGRVKTERTVNSASEPASTLPLASESAPVAQTSLVDASAVAQAIAHPSNESKTLRSTGDFTYAEPVALNKPMARTVVQGIADKFNKRLLWASAPVQLKGPITLLGDSLEEDLNLLRKALGVYSPLTIDVSPNGDMIRVVSKVAYAAPEVTEPASSVFLAQSNLPAATINEPTQLAAVAQNHVEPSNAPALRANAAPVETPAVAVAAASVETAASTSTPAEPEASIPNIIVPVTAVDLTTSVPALQALPADAFNEEGQPVIKLEIPAGQALEVVLKEFVSTHGYTLDWQVKGGFDAKRALSFRGVDVPEVLGQVLPPLQISADIYSQKSHIIIRPADAVLDR